MTTPARFRAAFITALTAALPDLVDAAWKAAEAPLARAPTPIRQREARAGARRMEKNRIRLETKELISQNDEKGLTKSELRHLLVHQMGLDVKESTLKRALMDLRGREEIETRNSRWHLAPPLYSKGRR